MPRRRFHFAGATDRTRLSNFQWRTVPLKNGFSRSPREFWILGRALFAVAAVRVALWLLPAAAAKRIARCILAAGRQLPARRCCRADQVLRAVISAGKHSPVGSTCLATALVGQALMHRHGHPCELRVGVRRDHLGKFGAHAWLERDGAVILNGPVDFVALYAPFPKMEHLLQ